MTKPSFNSKDRYAVNEDNFMLLRYNTDGSLDTSFNPDGLGSGLAGIVVSNDESIISDIEITSEGHITVVGTDLIQGYYHNAIAMSYDSNGILRSDFGDMHPIRALEDSEVIIDTSDFGFEDSDDDTFDAVIIEQLPSQGSLLLNDGLVTNGQTISTVDIEAGNFVFRPDADTYGSDYADIIYRVQDNGGTTNGGQNISQNVATLPIKVSSVNDTPYFTPSSKLGIVTTDLADSWDYANSIIVDDGKILVAGGGSNVNGNNDFMLVRYTADGSLDTSFNPEGLGSGKAGIVTTDLADSRDKAYSMVIDDGKILVAGVGEDADGNGDFMLVRYNTDGSLDTSFNPEGLGSGKAGIVTTDLADSWDYANSIIVDDGKILVVGRGINASGNSDLMLVHYNADGSLDTSFNPEGLGSGKAGIVITDLVGGWDYATSMVVDNGKILVAGKGEDGIDNDDFMLVRYNVNGSRDTEFGSNQFIVIENTSRYIEGETTVLHNELTINDIEATNLGHYDDAKLILSREGVDQQFDSYSGNGNLQLTDYGSVVLNNSEIGTYKTEYQKLSIRFDHATQDAVNETLQSISFSNDSLSKNEMACFNWKFIDADGGVAVAHQYIELVANPDEHTLQTDDTSYHFMEPITLSDDAYYYYDEDNNDSVNTDGVADLISHDSIDIMLNNGADTTDSARTIDIDGHTVQLPTIDELVDLYNNPISLEQLTSNNSDNIYWSATVGSSGNEQTHMALDVSTGQILELADTTQAEAIFYII